MPKILLLSEVASFWAQLASCAYEVESNYWRVFDCLMVKKVHVVLLSHYKVPKHLLSSLLSCKKKRGAVPRWNYESVRESDINREKVDLLKPTQKLPLVLRLAYKISRLRTQCCVTLLLYSNYCEIVSAVHVAISCPCSPEHPLLSDLFDNFFPRALQQDGVNAEVWSFSGGKTSFCRP